MSTKVNLGGGWWQYTHTDGRLYYHHKPTAKTQWNKPDLGPDLPPPDEARPAALLLLLLLRPGSSTL